MISNMIAPSASAGGSFRPASHRSHVRTSDLVMCASQAAVFLGQAKRARSPNEMRSGTSLSSLPANMPVPVVSCRSILVGAVTASCDAVRMVISLCQEKVVDMDAVRTTGRPATSPHAEGGSPATQGKGQQDALPAHEAPTWEARGDWVWF